jgi:DnaJ-class molecular chaperone
MAEIQMLQKCPACNGTGIRYYNSTPGGPLITENPCLECGGDGKSSASFTIDTTDIMGELDAIKKKVVKIWNKVKDPGEE